MAYRPTTKCIKKKKKLVARFTGENPRPVSQKYFCQNVATLLYRGTRHRCWENLEYELADRRHVSFESSKDRES